MGQLVTYQLGRLGKRMFTLPEPSGNDIDARPSKSLFVGMITRDITIEDAIMDFVDNSVDQAKRLEDSKVADLTSFYIRIELRRERFLIEDNCGGMELEVAQTRAFRFGRPDDIPSEKGTIGRFGIGMKRAFFKLGRHFNIISKASASSFTVDVSVPDWTQDKYNWSFPVVSPAVIKDKDPSWHGYRVEIDQLHDYVAANFGDGNTPFVNALETRIRLAHQAALVSGIEISINGRRQVAQEPSLLWSNVLQPATYQREFAFPDKSPIYCRVTAGLSDPKPQEAGWYVYCNARLIARADKSIATGWGESSSSSIPQYHNNFARFRGYVFLDSDDPDLLPWNTTKSALDTNSPTFTVMRPLIIEAARPVLDFLNKLANEAGNDVEEQPLTSQVEQATSFRIGAIPSRVDYLFPSGNVKPTTGRISFTRPLTQIEKMKEIMGVTRPKEVGETAFDYYYENEVGE